MEGVGRTGTLLFSARWVKEDPNGCSPEQRGSRRVEGGDLNQTRVVWKLAETVS